MRTEDLGNTSRLREVVFRIKAATLSEQLILISTLYCDITEASGYSLPTFQDNLSVPSWRVKKSKKKVFMLDFLTFDDETDKLSRNAAKKLPLEAA
jgi:hypothetical protein